MATIVEYVLSLKDQMTGGLINANAEVNKLEGSLGTAKGALTSLTGMLGTLGVGFAIFKGAEFVHEGIESFHKIKQSMAQVEAGLKSTGEAAGMTKNDVTDMAKEMSSRMKFGRADILDMQAQMLTFGGLTKENFPAIGDAIANVATKIGMDLHGMSIQFGKAMDNPADGIKKLMRQGVMFSQQQEDAIDKLVAKGNIVAAQQIMLTEIANKYGGSSKAAFDADPLAKYNKTMGSVMLSVGEGADMILEQFIPALESFASSLKTAAGWIKENGTQLWHFVKVAGIAYVAYKGLIISLGLMQAGLTLIAPAAEAAASGLAATGAAATISTGGIGLLIAAIAGVIFAYQEWDGAEERKKASSQSFYDSIKSNEEEQLKTEMAGYEKRGLSQQDAFNKTIDNNKAIIQSNLAAENLKISKIPTDDLRGLQLENETRNSLLQKQSSLFGVEKVGMIPHAVKEKIKKEEAQPATRATGSKSVTINVAIKELVGTQNINTTNLKESAGKIKDFISNVLAEAVNDFQVAALNH